MKKVLKNFGICLLGIILLIVLLLFTNVIADQYNYNHKYSIAMPTIMGEYNVSNDSIKISGLNNIKNENIGSLVYTEMYCIPSRKYCSENRFGVMGLGNQISIFPYHYEYAIKYADKNKILFEDDLFTSGEIDLNAKTLVFTVKNAGIDNKETRIIEILTDNKEIEKLEKKIISKYLKRKIEY